MTNREEIINSLNACMDVHRSGLWSSGCAFCSYAKQSNPKCFMNLTQDAVALLREEPEQKHGHWICTKDRLPEKDGKYLCVWQGRSIDTGMFTNGHFRLYGEVKDKLVSHWMSLPEPPKEESDD